MDELEEKVEKICLSEFQNLNGRESDEEIFKAGILAGLLNSYSEEDLLKASQYGYEYHQNINFPDTSWEDNCKNNTRQWLTTLKEQKDE